MKTFFKKHILNNFIFTKLSLASTEGYWRFSTFLVMILIIGCTHKNKPAIENNLSNVKQQFSKNGITEKKQEADLQNIHIGSDTIICIRNKHKYKLVIVSVRTNKIIKKIVINRKTDKYYDTDHEQYVIQKMFFSVDGKLLKSSDLPFPMLEGITVDNEHLWMLSENINMVGIYLVGSNDIYYEASGGGIDNNIVEWWGLYSSHGNLLSYYWGGKNFILGSKGNIDSVLIANKVARKYFSEKMIKDKPELCTKKAI